MNRSNSFVSSLKWWPLQGHNGHNGHTNTSHSAGALGGLRFGSIMHFNKGTNYSSSVAVQKLRESKWFRRDEQRIFCAVVECGFIVEVRDAAAVALKAAQQQRRLSRLHSKISYNSSCSSYEEDEEISDDVVDFAEVGGYGVDDDDDEMASQDENETPVPSWFGIVLCKTTKDHKAKPETIEIFSVKIRENGTVRMIRMPLEDIWNNGLELRINNFADKEKPAHSEKDIRSQVSFARKAKQSLWNNDKHFAYWCRYGSRQQDVRKRQMSECVKWGSVGMNAGVLLLMNKQRSYSTSQ